MVALAIAWLLSACASESQEGVVTERNTEPKMTAVEAHFPKPSYAPNGEGGSSSGHF